MIEKHGRTFASKAELHRYESSMAVKPFPQDTTAPLYRLKADGQIGTVTWESRRNKKKQLHGRFHSRSNAVFTVEENEVEKVQP